VAGLIYFRRYGPQVGEVTHHAMYAVGNTLLTAHNINELGPKAIAKRAVKDTGKVLVEPSDKGKTWDKSEEHPKS